MLTLKNSQVATNLSEVFYNEGIKLVVKKSTLLDNLSQAIHNNWFYGKINTIEPIPQFIVGCSTGETVEDAPMKRYVPSEHDSYMDNIITDLVNHTSNYISYARNVVKSDILRCKESVMNQLDTYGSTDIDGFIRVSYYKLPAIYGDSNTMSEISNNSGGVAYNDADINLSGVDINLNHLLTGDENEDDMITEWASSLPNGYVRFITMTRTDVYKLDTLDMLDYHLANYLFYRNIALRKDIEVGLSLVELTNRAIANKNYHAGQAKEQVSSLFTQLNAGKLILNRPANSFNMFDNKTVDIIVSEDNFSKLAEGGGSIETIYGYVASDDFPRQNNTVDDMLSSRERYSRIWDNARAIFQRNMDDSLGSIYRTVLANIFEGSVNEIDGEDYNEYTAANPGYREKVLKEGNEYISRLKAKDVECLDKVLLDLIAGIKYSYTCSYDILSSISDHLTRDPDCDPSQAALLAVLDYVVKFMLDQLDVVKL